MNKQFLFRSQIATFFSILFIFNGIYLFAKNPKSNAVKQGMIFSSRAKVLPGGFNMEYNFREEKGFIENKGQITDQTGLPSEKVKFVFKQEATQIFFLKTGIAYQFSLIHYPEGYEKLIKTEGGILTVEKLNSIQTKIRTETFRMDMNLAGANPDAKITTEGVSVDYINYYNHNALDVHHYTKIIYHEIYPKIDWVIYTKNGEMKYDFVLKPGADASDIKMVYKHYEGLRLNNDGSFTLTNRMGSISEKKPTSSQGHKKISTRFVLNDNIITFALDDYDINQSLIIDPALIWATYYGSTGQEEFASCSNDPFGNVYLSGATSSSNFIASGGHQNTYGGNIWDGFLVKFNSAGLRQWATYYGGTGLDIAVSNCTDGSGNVYVAGTTNSSVSIAATGFQTAFGGGTTTVTDAFLVKFDANGIRQWATYYGDAAQDNGSSCCTDGSGNVYLAGQTVSPNSIAAGGHQNIFGGGNFDGFLVKFSSGGIRLWGTYYGGSGDEINNSCSTDGLANVYLIGTTSSSSSIASGGHQNSFIGINYNAFLVKFNSSGSRQWATYYGDVGTTYGQNCCIDPVGNVFMCGSTSSTISIASGGHQNIYGGANSDAYLVKFNSGGGRQWATYYGGASPENGYSCLSDAFGNIYLSGSTGSTLNIASGGYQNTLASSGSFNAFAAKFNTNGIRQWGTYYGGPGVTQLFSASLDPSGYYYLSGRTNCTSSITSGGYQNSYGGNNDVFLAKFCDDNFGQPASIIGNTLVCSQTSHVYSITPISGATGYLWNLPSGWLGSSTTNSISVMPSSTGTLSVSGINTCGQSSIQTINITLSPAPPITVISSNTAICEGESATFTATGANTYTWSSGATGNIFVASPIMSSTYSLMGTDINGCNGTSNFAVTVNSCTGISESISKNKMIIKPNPNNGIFQILSDAPEITKFVIYNYLGEKIMESSFVQEDSLVDISSSSQGIYTIVFYNNKVLSTGRIIKE